MDMIGELLAGRLRDTQSGDALRVPVKRVVIEKSLAGSEADLIAGLDLPAPYAVISDYNTHEALGRRVEAALAGRGVVSVRLPGRPHPDEQTATKVMAAGAKAGSYIAVGSGTINDLAKFSAAQQGKRCAVFATAPSMNGYTSVNVAITMGGHKKSLPAVAPEGVFCDLSVLAAAPVRLIRAGFGDAICRSTAQADWYMAHRLRGSSYRAMPFALFADLEEEMVQGAEALARGDAAAVEALTRVLLLSGFGMTICGGSYPASQGEHLISHYIEMLGSHDDDAPMHGEQIAVTTLVMARLQEDMFSGAPPRLKASSVTLAELACHFGEELGRDCMVEIMPKLLNETQADELNTKLERIWPSLTGDLRKKMRPASEIADALRRCGAPTDYHQIGLSRAFFSDAVLHAREIRNRYTFLDLAADSRRLLTERLIDR
ncbi:MAG: sn-glycerol-1-phosphate dehydrogenase [Rhizobiales bacterium]|nr:sn-glycerol-1-phosphate dehydrogenase [Hyphomicrobiales bacterium]